MVAREPDVHEALIQDERQKSDPIEAMITLRNHVDSLPDTAATFTLRDVIDDARDEMTARWIKDDHIWLLGSWELPQFYPGESDVRKFVNPSYPHRDRYSPCGVECECGAVVYTVPGNGRTSRFHEDRDHNDDCLIEYRAHAVSEIYRRRRRLLRQRALLAKSSGAVEDVLHVSGEWTGVSDVSSSLDIPLSELKQRGFEKRKNTIERLLQDHPTEVVARVYDMGKSNVRSIISRHSDKTITELRS